MNLPQARREVATKSDHTIELETAEKWAQRATACYEYAREAKTPEDREGWLLRADEYAGEALEHGALVRDLGKTVKRLELALNKASRVVSRRHRRK